MPRALRIEQPGACYHVINRGNHRYDLFATDGAAQALREQGVPVGWISKNLHMGKPSSVRSYMSRLTKK